MKVLFIKQKNQEIMMRKFLITTILLFVLVFTNIRANGQTQSPPSKVNCDSCIVSIEYFFNHDPGFGYGIPIPITEAEKIENLTLDLDISMLEPGFNHFYVRAKDGKNNWSLTGIKSFYKEVVYPLIPDIIAVEYFLDTDPGDGNGIQIPITASNNIGALNFVADISDLQNGFHHIYIRAKDANGKWSLTNIKSIFKETINPNIPDITSIEYFLDHDPGEGNVTEITIQAASNLAGINFIVDISAYENGFHNLCIRARDANGSWSLTNTMQIYKETILAETPGIVFAEYFLDEDPGKGNGTEIPITSSPNIGGINLNIDISECSKGFHKLYVRAKDANGKWSFTNFKSFYKESIPAANLNIVKAEYFFNEDPGLGNGFELPIVASTNIQNYTFVAEIIDLPVGENTVFVRAMDQNGHWSLTNIQNIIIDPHPKITLSPDFWMDCSYYDFDMNLWLPITLSATVEDAASTAWTSDGDGTFDDPGNSSANYFPGENDVINGEVEITLTATGFEDNLTVNKTTTLHIPTQIIPISQNGWRGISSYIENGYLLVSEVLVPIENYLMIMKDADGNAYNPATGVNEIGNWDAVGYMANFTNTPACLPLYGDYISSKVFEVNGSQTYLPVLTDSSMAIEDLFNGHLDQIQMIYDWSTFQSWTPGNAGFTHLKPGFAYSLTTVSDADQFTIEFPPFSWEEPLDFITIHGKITDENEDGLENAEVSPSGNASVFTDVYGEYNAVVPVNWSGEITVNKNDWTFLPESINLENVVVNIYDMDFEGIDNSCDPGWTFTQTPIFHTISIPLNASPALFGEALNAGDWIGVFYLDENGEDRCGGSLNWTGTSNTQITAFGNNPTSPEKDGFDEGEQIQWKIYSCAAQQGFPAFAEYNPLMPQASGEFENYGFSSLTSLAGWICQEIHLSENWNDVSLWIQPQNSDVENIFAPMVNNLAIMKNLSSLYWPENSINTIGSWDINSGYVVKMYEESLMEICGSPKSSSTVSFSLDENSWFYLPVLSQCPVDANEFFYNEQGNIVIVKDLLGQKVWWPEAGIYSLEELLPGEAYEIKIKDDLDLTFPYCEDNKSMALNPDKKTIHTVWGSYSFSPFTHAIAFPVHLTGEFQSGTQIGVFGQSGNLYGAYEVSGETSFAILVNGDDTNTSEIEGMIEGEEFNFRIYDPASGNEFPLEVEFDEQMPQGGYFVNHGLSVVKSLQHTDINEFSNSELRISVYPNPSTGVFQVSTLSAPKAFGVTLTEFGWEVTNTHGSVIANGNNQTSEFEINLSKHTKGIYYLKIAQDDFQTVKKLVVQ